MNSKMYCRQVKLTQETQKVLSVVSFAAVGSFLDFAFFLLYESACDTTNSVLTTLNSTLSFIRLQKWLIAISIYENRVLTMNLLIQGA